MDDDEMDGDEHASMSAKRAPLSRTGFWASASASRKDSLSEVSVREQQCRCVPGGVSFRGKRSAAQNGNARPTKRDGCFLFSEEYRGEGEMVDDGGDGGVAWIYRLQESWSCAGFVWLQLFLP